MRRVAVDEPEVRWAMLHARCTGRNSFSSPKCPEYEIKVFADGRVHWRGLRFVETVGEATHSISSVAARKLIDDTERRLARLSELECSVDHAYYYSITVGEPGVSEVTQHDGCGRPFAAAGRAIARASKSARYQ